MRQQKSAGRRAEQEHRGDRAGQREGPGRHHVAARQPDQHPLERQEARRSELIFGQRRVEVEDRQPHQVIEQRPLVHVQRPVVDVAQQPEDHPDGDRRPGQSLAGDADGQRRCQPRPGPLTSCFGVNGSTHPGTSRRAFDTHDHSASPGRRNAPDHKDTRKPDEKVAVSGKASLHARWVQDRDCPAVIKKPPHCVRVQPGSRVATD